MISKRLFALIITWSTLLAVTAFAYTKLDYRTTGLRVSIIKRVLAGEEIEVDYRGQSIYISKCHITNTEKVCSNNESFLLMECGE